ncbi:uncharacterized protein LOC134848867 isoform X2 [Symsagittifera roscoffensis]|uniref:uncharacterized protein LOC134848867 isoform X2 n=1 Tax=Symsagittifera roscoffensis TaxID=84072 RepID=UPI00307B882C
MGGDTFPNTVRLSREALRETRETVLKILGSLDYVARFCSPKEVGDKESFGDVDFIVCLSSSELMNEFRSTLHKEIDAVEASHMGDHLSYLSSEQYQIDVLVVPESEFDSAKGFYSNGDFSYCVGKMIYKFNLKWSSKGLTYQMKKPDVDIRNLANSELEVVLSRNTHDAFEFLGFEASTIGLLLDPSTEINQQQLIQFLEECKFYRAFLRNEKARKRLFNKHRERRPMVRAFFDHCESKAELMDPVSLEVKTPGESKIVTEDEILEHFKMTHKKREMLAKIESMIQANDKRKEAKEKFNGTFVEKWYPEVSKPQIGKIFAALRNHIGEGSLCSEDEYFAWILSTDADAIKLTVHFLYMKLKNTNMG